MAEHKYQQQDLRAGLQHLANLNQDSAAYLQHQCQPQVALAEIQALERQRLGQQAPVLQQRR